MRKGTGGFNRTFQGGQARIGNRFHGPTGGQIFKFESGRPCIISARDAAVSGNFATHYATMTCINQQI